MKKERIKELLQKRSGLNITQYAKSKGVKRELAYQAFEGKGSRSLRIAIAQDIGKKPSEIWLRNSKNVKILDDHEYNESMADA